MMDLVLPSRKFIRRSLIWILLLSILILWAFAPSSKTPQEDTEVTNGVSSSNTTSSSPAFSDQVPNETIEDVEGFDQVQDEGAYGGVNVQFPKLTQQAKERLIKSIILTIIATLALAIGYMIQYNNADLILYLKTAFRLAGFDIQVSSFGRSWSFNHHSSAKLIFARIGGFKLVPKMKFTLPYQENFQNFGFTKLDSDQVLAICHLEQLQIALQLIATYLESE